VTARTLAYSPCPNDTFIFAALTKGLLDGAPPVEAHLADIDELNAAAERGEYELVKVSYGALPYLTERYRILRSGGAVGRGCGPLLVARPENAPELFADVRQKRVAIPGERTTAFLLLQMALGGRPKHVERMRFDRIVPAVAEGKIEAGLIIHESRFTYRDAGLIAIVDLGQWWENFTLLPIPLGAILVRKDIPVDEARRLGEAIRGSLAFARANPGRVMPYVREHAVEMSDEVMRRHIDLYVNEFTDDLTDEGMQAVAALLSRAREAGVVTKNAEVEFVA
jgi:1,4-dihydroxy-6-naphthoate synthase